MTLHVAGSRPRPCTCGCTCEPVTSAELDMLVKVAQGWTILRIANSIGIPKSTVGDRMRTLMAKLGAVDRSHLVTCAFRDRLLGFDRDGRVVVAKQGVRAA